MSEPSNTQDQETAEPSADTFVVTFDRIGRNHDVPPLTITAGDADEAAFHIYQYGRKFLVSNDVECLVDYGQLRGSFNYGRFGSFTLSPVAA